MRLLRAAVGGLTPRSLQAQMITLLGLLVLVQIGISGIIFGSLVADILENQIGKRALDIAETVARDPVVVQGLSRGDPDGQVQQLAESVRSITGAEYVVVADRDGKRLSHPDTWKIGQKFVGGDEDDVLAAGRSYVSRAVGTLGPSLRGFAPVVNGQGEVQGFVAVGYLQQDVNRTILAHQLQPRVFVFMMALVGLLGAVIIAGRFKRAILGLEPREIASLYRERGAIIETIREGVVAVDRQGGIRLANAAARRDLGLDENGGPTGQSLESVLPGAEVATVLEDGRPILDREVIHRGVALIMNLIPVRHEHSNQLHTVAGLIQIGASQEALDMITGETAGFQDLVELLNTAVPHPLLSGLILGKCNRASEMKVHLTIDPDSGMADIPAHVPQEKLVTILGNLLDNGLEAAVAGKTRPGQVRLSMTDLGRDLVFEVEDSGPGVPEHLRERIFSAGFTSKTTPGHGVGLHLVAASLRDLGGEVTVGAGEFGGALFTAIIPKQEAGPA